MDPERAGAHLKVAETHGAQAFRNGEESWNATDQGFELSLSMACESLRASLSYLATVVPANLETLGVRIRVQRNSGLVSPALTPCAPGFPAFLFTRGGLPGRSMAFQISAMDQAAFTALET